MLPETVGSRELLSMLTHTCSSDYALRDVHRRRIGGTAEYTNCLAIPISLNKQ